MKMKTLAVGAVFLGMFSSATVAADLYEPAPMVHGSPFSGFYMGVHGGYGWANRSGFAEKNTFDNESIFEGFDEEDAFDKYNQEGWMLGLQAGADYVFDSGLLIGAEVRGSWADIDGTGSDFFNDDCIDCGPPEGFEYTTTYNAVALAQGKLGWAFDQFAVYISGGFAVAHSDTTIVENVGIAPSVFEYDSTDTGWTVGGGAKMMVYDNVALGFNYNYIDLDTSKNFDTDGLLNANTFRSEVDGEMHVFMLNLDYYFSK